MTWWIWAIIGLTLFAAEAAGAGGFFLAFFAAGAIFVSLLSLAQVVTDQSIQWILFAVVSFASMFLFRSHLVKSDENTPSEKDFDRDAMVGVVGDVSQDIEPGGRGKVSIRGASWSAYNRTEETLPAGSRCVVVDIDGLTLGIKREE